MNIEFCDATEISIVHLRIGFLMEIRVNWQVFYILRYILEISEKNRDVSEKNLGIKSNHQSTNKVHRILGMGGESARKLTSFKICQQKRAFVLLFLCWH